jgi:hypothetical protein
MRFNDTGTLINWRFDDINIVEPLHSKEGGGSRGGVYLCIPNFEALSPPFSIKHGEYRITSCDSRLPHQKNLSSSTENNWGNVDVVTDWQEIEEGNNKTLNVSTSIRAISDLAWVRPGFHPYFSVTPGSFIDIGPMRIDLASFPHDSMQKFKPAALFEPVKLTTANYSVTVNCSILSVVPEHPSIMFAVWSDKKHQYVCIEPVIGNQAAGDDLPAPFTLVKNQELKILFTLSANRTGSVFAPR